MDGEILGTRLTQACCGCVGADFILSRIVNTSWTCCACLLAYKYSDHISDIKELLKLPVLVLKSRLVYTWWVCLLHWYIYIIVSVPD